MNFAKLIALSFLVLFQAQIFAGDLPPMKVKQLVIEDKEYLKFSELLRGAKYADCWMLTLVSPDKKTADVYFHQILVGSKLILPVHYSNYQIHQKISLERGSLIQATADMSESFKEQNMKGEIANNLSFDTSNNLATYVSRQWDGFDTHTATSRIKIRPDYPCWDLNGMILIASRCLQNNDKEMLYCLTPTIVKDPLPGNFRFLRKETVTNKAGVFNTVKYGLNIVDPFLAVLMESFTKECFFWVEDSPRGLVVRTYSAGQEFQLEEISLYKGE